ncbi:hypothetical protein BHE74_00043168 [Ensete ventricosum]|uniref:Uncharacterized protein n=1 Tax=Ensete ventricosum TaxID=4639 RepID=A0A444GE17_ENSVE|nr:hypothetical protein GW17_00002176 [Ensete ventricosum]RWW50550.1 hypothetical protein BHE74_00043168 [Ensete ventricosum]RZR74603.1 hypothetical protein BHM03_00039226 [Ensete ventricosum]
MKVIESAQDLHDSLLDAGDKLVIVDLDVEAAGSSTQRSRNLKMHWPSTARIGAALGLEESELLALAANQDLYFNYTRKPVLVPSLDDVADRAPASPIYLAIPAAPYMLIQDSEDKALITAGG